MSFVNAVLSGSNQPKPEAGMPATFCHYSDRNPGTITEVVLFASGAKKGEVRGVKVRGCDWTIIRGSEHDGSAVYEYTERPDAPSRLFLRDSHGAYACKGTKLSIGARERYYDPHF